MAAGGAASSSLPVWHVSPCASVQVACASVQVQRLVRLTSAERGAAAEAVTDCEEMLALSHMSVRCNCMYGVTKARTVPILDVTTVVLIIAQSDGFAAQSGGIAVFIVRLRCPVTNDVNKAGWIST